MRARARTGQRVPPRNCGPRSVRHVPRAAAPLYLILRKIERIGENLSQVSAAEREHRISLRLESPSHIDYLVQPLVLDGSGIRPPLIAAGINLSAGRSD